MTGFYDVNAFYSWASLKPPSFMLPPGIFIANEYWSSARWDTVVQITPTWVTNAFVQLQPGVANVDMFSMSVLSRWRKLIFQDQFCIHLESISAVKGGEELKNNWQTETALSNLKLASDRRAERNREMVSEMSNCNGVKPCWNLHLNCPLHRASQQNITIIPWMNY